VTPGASITPGHPGGRAPNIPSCSRTPSGAGRRLARYPGCARPGHDEGMAHWLALGRCRGRRGRTAGWLTAAGLLAGWVGGCTSSSPPAHSAGAGPGSLGCTTATTTGRALTGVRPVTTAVPGSPAAVVATADGRWEFASLTADRQGEIAVLAVGHGAPRLVRTVDLPESLPAAFEMTLTHDGRLLVVAGYTGTAVMSVQALEDGRPNPALGVLSDAGAGEFGVAVSADDRYVYVTDESTGGLSVFSLALALRDGFGAAGVAVGIVPLVNVAQAHLGAVDLALSPDGKLAYVTTGGGYVPTGQLWVIDLGRADAGAARAAVLAHAAAGCSPSRVAVSPDGSTAWVTVEESNALLAFSTAELQRDPGHALRAVVRVGSEPVGLLLAGGGRVALVANSNRGLVSGTASQVRQTVSVIGTAAALAHRPALLGAVPAGLFPRGLSIDPSSGQVLLANYNSGAIEQFPVPDATGR
jgi:hypothetical protein